MGKKMHLKLEEVTQKIHKIERQLSQSDTQSNKTKKKRLYSQLAKLRKAAQNPEQCLVNPDQYLAKVQEDKQKRIQKKIDKKKDMVLAKKKEKKHQKCCLKCGSRKHLLLDCDSGKAFEIEKDTKLYDKASGYCFKCGSQSHSHRECSEQQYKLAYCFFCGQKGHIARECEKNSKGLYRKGGSCFGCGSVRHTYKDCSERRGKIYFNKDQF